MPELPRSRELERHPLGFWRIKHLPTDAELANYYKQQYYGRSDGHTQFAHVYTDAEYIYKSLPGREASTIFARQPGRLLEVGVGEGFTLAHFKDLGWEVGGLDFTRTGVLALNPAVADKVVEGNAFALLDDEIANGEQYDAVICNNVLEHVRDPIGLLERLRHLLAPNGIVRIQVPNDGSWLQNLVVERGQAPPDFWVAVPDHLSYFDTISLRNLIEHSGFAVTDMLCEFPVDLFLLNSESNYLAHPERGRASHFARVAFEIALAQRSIEDLVLFRRACAATGLGRSIAVYSVLAVS
jgi:SAM-dependent methyltransferase